MALPLANAYAEANRDVAGFSSSKSGTHDAACDCNEAEYEGDGKVCEYLLVTEKPHLEQILIKRVGHSSYSVDLTALKGGHVRPKPDWEQSLQFKAILLKTRVFATSTQAWLLILEKEQHLSSKLKKAATKVQCSLERVLGLGLGVASCKHQTGDQDKDPLRKLKIPAQGEFGPISSVVVLSYQHIPKCQCVDLALCTPFVCFQTLPESGMLLSLLVTCTVPHWNAARSNSKEYLQHRRAAILLQLLRVRNVTESLMTICWNLSQVASTSV